MRIYHAAQINGLPVPSRKSYLLDYACAPSKKKAGRPLILSKIKDKMERSEGGEWINKYGSATLSIPTACNLEL